MTPFNKLVNNIISEMLDGYQDDYQSIGSEKDINSKDHAYTLELKAEIEELHDKLGYPTSNLSDKSIAQLEKMVEIARKDIEIQNRYENERPY